MARNSLEPAASVGWPAHGNEDRRSSGGDVGFYVDPSALSELPMMLSRLEFDAADGKDYVAKYAELEYGEGLLNKLHGGHTRVVSEITRFLGTLSRDVAGGTADAVAKSIGSYRRTDLETAAMVDATYGETNLASPGPSSIYLQAHANLSPFADTGRPTEAYRPVADYNSSFEHEWEMTDVVSPASMGRDVIWWATEQLTHFGFLDRAYDPYEAWIKPLCGDWAGLRGCADVFTNLATAVEHMGDNVYHSALKLPAVWQGNAADACQSHLISIQACLFAAATPFRAIAVEYKSAAMGAHDFRKTLSSLLSDLLDAALIFAIEVAAAGATSETIVGAIIFGGAAFYEGKIIVDLVRELIDVYGRFNAMVDATSSSVNDFGLVDADYALPRLPLATISPPS